MSLEAGVTERFARQVEALDVVTQLVEQAGCHVFLVHPDIHPEAPHPFICAMPDMVWEPEEMNYDPSDVTFDERTKTYAIWNAGTVVRRNVSAEFAANVIIEEYRIWDKILMDERTLH
jgi:hypothetical protein